MNDKEVLKRLYRAEIQPNGTKAFKFSIPIEFTKVKGFLFSPNTSLSVCFSDHKNMILEQYRYSYTTTSRIAPKDRIFTLEVTANNQTITGTIKNEMSAVKTISIYILLQ